MTGRDRRDATVGPLGAHTAPHGALGAPTAEPEAPTVADAALGALVRDFLAGRKATTLRAYRRSLQDFGVFLGAGTVEDAARTLLASGPGPANLLVHRYKTHLVERELAPNTVNSRLAAVRSLAGFARLVGVVTWTVSVPGVRTVAYKDVRGPGRGAVRDMLREIEQDVSPKGRRDLAILRLLVDLALRRAEVVSLDVEHVDVAGATVLVLGKGHAERVPLTLPSSTTAALTAWLEVRGTDPGPLFVSCVRGGTLKRDRQGALRRVTGADVYRLVRRVSAAAGVGAVRPHALRHFAVTAALDATGGDVRRVQRYSRHANVQVLLRYDDARQDDAGDVARLVAARVGG